VLLHFSDECSLEMISPQILHATEGQIPQSPAMVKYCAVIGKPVWTAFIAYRRLTEARTLTLVEVATFGLGSLSFSQHLLAVLPHVSTAGFTYKDTSEVQAEVRQAMAGVMDAITTARTEILFMYKVSQHGSVLVPLSSRIVVCDVVTAVARCPFCGCR
jgi:hypothetical protein